MPNVNYKQLYAIKKNNEKRILSVCPRMKNQSGIYFYTRTDENGISYFYIGQSVDCLERNVSHLSGYQHIDLSIKKEDFIVKKIRMDGNWILSIIRERNLMKWNNIGFWNIQRKVINAVTTKRLAVKAQEKKR